MMRSAQRDQDKLVVITGRISSTGEIISGTGFTASRTAQGTYLIRFLNGYIIGLNVTGNTADYRALLQGTPQSDNISMQVDSFNGTNGGRLDFAFSFSVTLIAKS